jgi:hypothetical protein
MANFDDFIEAVEKGAKELAKKTLKEFGDEAASDAKDFLEKSKDDLDKWKKLVSDGELPQDDFKWLVRGRKDVAEMNKLKETGLAMARIDEFKDELFDLIVDIAFDVFL